MEIKLRVKCPYCGAERSTSSVKRVLCFKCGRSFKVFYKKKKKGYAKSTIKKIEKGSLKKLHEKFYRLKREEFMKKNVMR
jgi:transposase-like protein